MSLLFEDLFKRLNTDLKRQADAVLSKVGGEIRNLINASDVVGSG